MIILKKNAVYWDKVRNEPVILLSTEPDKLLGFLRVSYHPSTGKTPSKGYELIADQKNLRELTPLELELL
jgi:hypothetical protein